METNTNTDRGAIVVGSMIRSYDFEPRAEVGECFAEGRVLEVDQVRGVIHFTCTRDVWTGVEVTDERSRVGQTVSTALVLFITEWPGRLVVLAPAPDTEAVYHGYEGFLSTGGQ